MKIREALKYGISKLKNISDSAHLDADILLLHAISSSEKSKIWLNNNLDYILKKEEIDSFKSYIERRSRLEPVAYIINKKFFYGLEFYVDNNVLIPRPESELLVNEALKIIHAKPTIKQTIIDIGTGSGALIISLAKKLHLYKQAGNHQFIGIDITPDIIGVAQKNSLKHGMEKFIKFLKGKFLDPIKSVKLKNKHLLLLANLPYLAKNEYAANPALKHEPQNALVSKDEGLGHYFELFKQLSEIDNPYTLIIEHHPEQTTKLYKIINKTLPETESTTIKDFTNRDRVTIIKNY